MCLFTLTLNCEIDMNLMYGRVNENVRKALHPYVYDHPNNQNPSLCVFVRLCQRSRDTDSFGKHTHESGRPRSMLIPETEKTTLA